jgi:t-SNARE complex subunit (syntaxin)
MQYKCLECAGYELAIAGAMLSKGKTHYDNLNDLTDELKDRANTLAAKLAGADGGHNKFLEQIQYWIAIDAPLYWWKQFDTYRIGVSKSSESTMFKMWKGGLTQEDFERPVYEETLERLNASIQQYMQEPSEELFMEIIGNLPDSFLQTRLVNINAKSLRNIYQQRRAHKLQEWKDFCEFIGELPWGGLITA